MKNPKEKKPALEAPLNPLGFYVQLSFKDPLTNYQKEHFWEDLAAVAESNGLDFSGGGEKEVNLFVTSVSQRAPSEEAIAALEHWLRSEFMVQRFEIGEVRRQMKVE